MASLVDRNLGGSIDETDMLCTDGSTYLQVTQPVRTLRLPLRPLRLTIAEELAEESDMVLAAVAKANNNATMRADVIPVQC
jgi:hypothetical protein